MYTPKGGTYYYNFLKSALSEGSVFAKILNDEPSNDWYMNTEMARHTVVVYGVFTCNSIITSSDQSLYTSNLNSFNNYKTKQFVIYINMDGNYRIEEVDVF